MKLLVLAQIPPPVHGQSVMVQTLVEGLPGQGLPLEHVNLRLSRCHEDIGRWRPGKLVALLAACARAVFVRFTRDCDTLYYVPAPGKRAALYRDWLVMLLSRAFFSRLVLHWHASGLGEWLRSGATAPERWLTRWLLGGADLALVLTPSLRADAEALAPKRIAIVPNGIADPRPDFALRLQPDPPRPLEVLFLGACSEEKGLFDAAAAIVEANRQIGRRAFRLTAAGSFGESELEARFRSLVAAHTGVLRHVGFVSGEAKQRLLAESDCLCLPTRYPHEGQPLVILEALAHGLPVVATNWRGIAESLPSTLPLVPPGDVAALTRALLQLRDNPVGPEALRRHYLAHFTVERHLGALCSALATL